MLGLNSDPAVSRTYSHERKTRQQCSIDYLRKGGLLCVQHENDHNEGLLSLAFIDKLQTIVYKTPPLATPFGYKDKALYVYACRCVCVCVSSC